MLISLCLIAAGGCVQAPPRPITYVSEGSVEHLDSVSARVGDIALRHRLRVFEKPSANMRTLNQGEDAIFIALYAGEHQVLVITNVGYGDRLFLAVTPGPGFPNGRAKELATEVSSSLRKSEGIVFTQQDVQDSSKIGR